ncbi:MAG: DUF6596 domain-containing protein [Acidimicrobiales bacterium]|nr:DUF6596 domain-containing protein [Acidimicrobiales bacterium]
MATLYRDLGDLAAAEDAAQEAAAIALERWLDDGIPDRPGAWITTVARRRAVDRIRRERTGREKTELLARLEEPLQDAQAASDDQLGLFFGCCHPALNVEAQIALTLRSLGGLTTAEIARAFLVPEATMAQRLVRAKRKISAATIPFRIPDGAEVVDRLAAVHHVLYLVFNEGAYPTSGADPTRVDLAEEAIRLAGLLADLMTDDAESHGLHALCLLIHARRDARIDGDDTVLLAHQDRSRWDRALIEAGERRLEHAMRLDRPGPYQIEAAIQALHDTATTAEETDWPQIVSLYRSLWHHRPTPIVALNLAVAVAEADGPALGLARLDTDWLRAELAEYRYYHAARADLLRRLDRLDEAADAYRIALDLTDHAPDRRFLQGRLAELDGPVP